MFNTIVNWVLTNIFGNTGMFMGLLVFIGLLVAGKKFYEALAGGIKGAVGFLIYNVASSGMSSLFKPILIGIGSKLNSEVLILDGSYGQAVIKTAVETVGRTLTVYTIAMVISLFAIIAMVYFKKWTKFRCVNIAANTLNGNSLMGCGMLILACPDLPDAWLIFGTFCFILLNTAFSNLALEDVQTFTNGAGFSVYHGESFMLWAGSRIGEIVEKNAAKKNKPVKKWDELDLPDWLSIFDDITVSSTLVMLVVFGVLMIVAGPATVGEAVGKEFSDYAVFLIYILSVALNFGVYMIILTTGIRMFCSELSVAFNAISSKLLNGGLPALDIAATYGFMKNGSVLSMSFFFATIFTELFTILCVILNIPFVPIIGFTALFFENGSAGMFAHEKGGIKAQIITNFVTAVLHVFVAGAFVFLMDFGQYGGFGVTSNFALIWTWMVPLVRALGIAGVIISFVVALALPQIQYAMNKDTYWLASEDWEEYKRVKAQKEAK